jgi:hypothetical protein
MKIESSRACARRALPCCAFIAASWSVLAAGSSVTITGTPPVEVEAGQPYGFAPRATVTGAGTPRFEIENLPRWASFSSFNGRLSGVPQNADAGVYPAIRIAVTDGVSRASLASFSITVYGSTPARSVSISWRPPTRYIDGTVLTDLAGYRIYAGPSASSLRPFATLNNPGLTRYVIDELAPGTHYFALTARSAAGAESALSNLAEARID